jgi:hypothetical protein
MKTGINCRSDYAAFFPTGYSTPNRSNAVFIKKVQHASCNREFEAPREPFDYRHVSVTSWREIDLPIFTKA